MSSENEYLTVNKMSSARPLYKRTSRRKMGRRNALRALERIVRELNTIKDNCPRFTENASLSLASSIIRAEINLVNMELESQ